MGRETGIRRCSVLYGTSAFYTAQKDVFPYGNKYGWEKSEDSPEDMGIELYQSDNFQIQEVGVFLLGYSAHQNASALPLIQEWLNSDCANVRRAVSEGLRVWTSRPYFKDNPQTAIQLLAAHREDQSEYVRKSIGNALRDISKKYPILVSEELSSWDLSSKEIKQVYKLAGRFLELAGK